MSNWIGPTVKQLWNYAMHLLHNFGFNTNTTGFCLGLSSLHLLLLKSSMAISVVSSSVFGKCARQLQLHEEEWLAKKLPIMKSLTSGIGNETRRWWRKWKWHRQARSFLWHWADSFSNIITQFIDNFNLYKIIKILINVFP